jgi:hypothetical protein
LITGLPRREPGFVCACAAASNPQLQKAMPAIVPAFLMNLLRSVMLRLLFFVGLASLRVTSNLLRASIFNNANYCVESHSCLLISPPLSRYKVLSVDWPRIACL